jgi:hypothetical protein
MSAYYSFVNVSEPHLPRLCASITLRISLLLVFSVQYAYFLLILIYIIVVVIVFIVCSVSFVVCVVLCAVFV